MKKILLTIAAAAVLAWGPLQAADKKPDVSKLPAPAAKKGVTYDTDIKPIFEKNCFKCHGPDKQKGKYRNDSLAAAIKGGESGDKAVVAGKSAESPMVHYIGYLVEDMEMPPPKDGKSHKISDAEIALIRAWIDQGAR
jgi:mono/diheme cytochrome c family protein